jgi:hypothetical protein
VIAGIDANKRNDWTMEPAPTEIDNHADTICFGRNFRPLYYTSSVATVSPFLAEYEAQMDVPIVTAATAYDTNAGETIILVFGQGLWFGDKMDRSLINPNQCRTFGINICDDPTDQHRNLGITLDGDYFVPMSMDGTICGFTSRCPSNDELASCRTFTCSDEQTWDPNADNFPCISAIEGGGNVNMFLHSNDNEYDNAMLQISPILTGSLVDRIISSTYTKERHHGADPELLARKWGIGTEKAKQTLKSTTQHNIRSAILPLTRRYKTDLLSQRMKRLSAQFYTDTAFSKDTSLAGNSCVQLFTDGQGFVVAYPMRSKSEAGTALQKFCRDIGVPNMLHMDNAPEMTGINTEFQAICKQYRIKTSTTEPHSPWQNKCENIIGVIKKRAKGRKIRKQIPKCVWDFGIV